MSKTLNWGWGGCAFIGFALVNFAVFLATGSGLTSRMGHQVKGWWAIFGSLAFLILGLLSLLVWLIKRMSGQGNRKVRR